MKKEINVEIGKRIRKQRESLGLTRERLAECANISSTFLADIELGNKGISPLTIQKLCNALHISADYLIRNKALDFEYPEIISLLSELDKEYIPLAEDILRTYVNSIKICENKKSKP